MRRRQKRFKQQKKCTECGKNIAFHNESGLCHHHLRLRWRDANKLKIREYQRQYREKNREKAIAYQKKYRLKKKNAKKKI